MTTLTGALVRELSLGGGNWVICGASPATTDHRVVDLLLGDASKARDRLGWSPQVDFPGLVRMMTDADMELVGLEKARAEAGLVR